MMHPGIQAEKTPEKPAYIMASTGQVVTFNELNKRSNQGAQLFRSLGLKPGDHIGLCMENNQHYLQICWSAQRAGLYYTCISSRLTPAELAYILNDCDAKVFIGSTEMIQLTEGLAKSCPQLIARYIVGAIDTDEQSWEEAIAAQPSVPPARQAP
tara:strand:+ start:137 stop:601 length:465 start_codon:yes stop_codon:yes gene_type:complete